jgi:hypothetical protein
VGNRFARAPRRTLLALGVALLALGLGLAELLVRTAALDFYEPELRAGTPTADLAPSARPTLIALGDSFTANPEGWVARLREGLGPRRRVIGSGVSGFTSRQLRRIAPGRIARFGPRVVAVQLYAGNDLLELRHPVDPRRGGLARSFFWSLSDLGLELPGLLNYRAGQLVDAFRRRRGDAPLPPGGRATLEALPFDPALYTARDRELLALDPWVVERQLRLTGGMDRAFAAYAADLRTLLAVCRELHAAAVVFVVPHAVEVAPAYQERFAALGARFEAPEALAAPESPFGLAVRRVVAAAPGAAFLDVKPALREAESRGRPVYRNNDSHFSAEGDRAVADALLAHLSRSGFAAEHPREE